MKQNISGDNGTRICQEIMDYDCLQEAAVNALNGQGYYYKKCKCLPGCNSIDYSLTIFEERFSENDGNTSSVSIYFADDEFNVFKRSASFGVVSLLSNVGGLLGLFLGISVMSVVEVFYYFVIRFVNNLWWRAPN